MGFQSLAGVMGVEERPLASLNVVCVGDCGVDRYLPVSRERPGGITYNFAHHARRRFRSGAQVHIVTALGDDSQAAMVADALDSSDCIVHARQMPGPTSSQEIELEDSGERIFTRYDQGVLGEHELNNAERELIQQADLLVTPMFEQIRAFFSSVIEIGCRGLTAVDFADIADYPSVERVTPFIDKLDIAFFGLRSTQDSLIQDLMRLAKEKDKLFVITLGPKGSLAVTRSRRAFQPAIHVEQVVDTTGAGDCFAAAFLGEYVQTQHLTHALRKGAHDAAVTISRIGAT